MKTDAAIFGWSSVADADKGMPASGQGLLGVVVCDEQRPLVLAVDLQARNEGASLTNVTAHATDYLRQQFALADETDWIFIDSMGAFDVVSAVNGYAGTPTWSPVTAEEQRPRTLEAFLAAYGRRGRAAWLKAEETLAALGVRVHTKRGLFDAGDERGAVHVLSARVTHERSSENAHT